MINSKKLIFIAVLFCLLVLSVSCSFTLHFGTELVSAEYIDSTHFRLTGRGGEWMSLAEESDEENFLGDELSVIITNQSPPKTLKVTEVSSFGCPRNQFVITVSDDFPFNTGDTVMVSGSTDYFVDCAVFFTVK